MLHPKVLKAMSDHQKNIIERDAKSLRVHEGCPDESSPHRLETHLDQKDPIDNKSMMDSTILLGHPEHEFVTTEVSKLQADNSFTIYTLPSPSNANHTANHETQYQTIACTPQLQPVRFDGITTNSFQPHPDMPDSIIVSSQTLSFRSNSTTDSPHFHFDMPDVNGNNPQSPSVRCVSITDGSKPHPFKPVWRIWGLGLMSISFSYLIFIAIVIVLASHSQKQLPSWPLKISLNSALAFLTTLAKAAFMWPVSNAISQAQWSWFLQDRPLYDFHLIDQASRGSWGALALLWRVRHRHFVTLAALLSIICVLTSPLTQLAIDYPSRYVPSPGADGAQVSSIGVLKSFVHENLVQAINKALNELPWPMKDYEYELVSPTGAVCSTGNCTFEELHSLGVCVEFADISSNLKIQRGDNLSLDASANDYYKYWIIDESNITIWNASIPQAYPHGRSLDLVHQGKLAVFMDVLTGNCSIAFLANENLMQTKVASLVLIRTVPVLETQGESDRKQIAEQSNYAEILSSIQEVRYEAIEILFHLCVQSYHIRVDRGIQNTTLVSSTTRPTESSSSFFMDFTCVDMAEDQVICDQLQESRFDRYNDTLYLEGPTNPSAVPELRGYGATYEAIETIAREMKALLMTFGQEHPLQVEERPEDIYLDLLFDTISRPLWTSIFLDPQNLLDPQRATDRIKTIFMNFAIGLSSGLRENRLRYQVSDEIGNITGIAWMEESYVNITWGWLTFLAVELVIATAFLFITILVQIRMRAKLATGGRNNISVVEDYKDSYLAPLFALSQEARFAAGGRLQPMDVMKETAKRVHVRLEGTEVVPSQMREAL